MLSSPFKTGVGDIGSAIVSILTTKIQHFRIIAIMTILKKESPDFSELPLFSVLFTQQVFEWLAVLRAEYLTQQ